MPAGQVGDSDALSSLSSQHFSESDQLLAGAANTFPALALFGGTRAACGLALRFSKQLAGNANNAIELGDLLSSHVGAFYFICCCNVGW